LKNERELTNHEGMRVSLPILRNERELTNCGGMRVSLLIMVE
jgi:hypothetical protein